MILEMRDFKDNVDTVAKIGFLKGGHYSNLIRLVSVYSACVYLPINQHPKTGNGEPNTSYMLRHKKSQ